MLVEIESWWCDGGDGLFGKCAAQQMRQTTTSKTEMSFPCKDTHGVKAPAKTSKKVKLRQRMRSISVRLLNWTNLLYTNGTVSEDPTC
jgi:hypothetical protein